MIKIGDEIIGDEKSTSVPIKYKQEFVLVITFNKIHSLKQVVILTYTMKKWFFVAATFEALWVVSFQNKETSSIL